MFSFKNVKLIESNIMFSNRVLKDVSEMLIYCTAANAYLDGQSSLLQGSGSPPVPHIMMLYDSFEDFYY